MPIGVESLHAKKGPFCSVMLLPKDCRGYHVDLRTGEEVDWSDPFPAGGLTAVGALCNVKSIQLDPVNRADEVINEDECDEHQIPGGLKYYEGDWTFSKLTRLELELVMGASNVYVDPTTMEPVASSPRTVNQGRCGCANDCAPSFAAIVTGPLLDVANSTATPTLNADGERMYWWQVHPNLRSLGMSQQKTQRAQDQDDPTATIRSDSGPRFARQLLDAMTSDNPPPWLPPATSVLSVGTQTLIDLTLENPFASSPSFDFYSPAQPPEWAANCANPTGWLNGPAVTP